MKETPQPRLAEPVALAALAGLEHYLVAHRQLAAAVGAVASPGVVMTAALAENVRLGLRTLLALAGAGMAARAAAWLLWRWGHG